MPIQSATIESGAAAIAARRFHFVAAGFAAPPGLEIVFGAPTAARINGRGLRAQRPGAQGCAGPMTTVESSEIRETCRENPLPYDHARHTMTGLALRLAALTTLCIGCSTAAPAASSPSPVAPKDMPTIVAGAKETSPASDAASGAATAAPEAAAPPAVASRFVKCEDPPVGMACVPGGPAVIGSDDHHANEKPRHTVEISTFYIDRFEVSNRQYEQCEQAGACPGRILPDRSFLGPDQPAVPLTWHVAHTYCLWAGKRLPTEAEWEKVARGGSEGRVFPWGSEAATCERAQTQGCPPDTTRPVGSFPAGPYGVHDMAGNGYEWVNDWASGGYEGAAAPCGAACRGLDPTGPCGGAPFCKGQDMRVLKGGSWRWAADEARGSWRRMELAASGAHRLGMRCASTGPWLSTWPPLSKTDPLPAPPDPEPPTPAETAKFRDVVEDTDILKIKPCEKGGGSRIDCRDPFSYITTNEPSQHVWLPYVENLGGGYVGIGSDQSYSFIGAARSRWAWIFDYDPLVVRVHYIIRAAVLAAETPAQLVEAFTPARLAAAREALAASLPEQERKDTDRTLLNVRAALHAEYSKTVKPDAAAGRFGWLRNADHYRHVRLLFQQGRIQVMKGNLLTDKAMPSIARSARALGVPVRILYTSNADDQWKLTRQFRDNIAALPMDDRSVALRTVYPREKQRVGVLGWEYVVQAGPDLQRKIVHDAWEWVWWFQKDGRKAGDDERVITVALPARTPRGDSER
jgi:formylglycine-generating enzyme required for sulfatase activity